MAWRIGGLSLGSTSAVETARDTEHDLSLQLAVTATERRQLHELAEFAGRVSEVESALGRVHVVDTSPNGENTVLVLANADAGQLGESVLDGGYYAWAEIMDDWQGSVTVNQLQALLKRIAGHDEGEVVTSDVCTFEAHDF